MHPPRPASKASELLHELELLFAQTEPPTEFALARLAREANLLAAVDAAEASMVKAGISALKWDIAEVSRHIENAQRLKRSTSVLLNSALTFRFVNETALACEHALHAARMAPNDGHVLTEAAATLISAGRVSKAVEVLDNQKRKGLALDGIEAEATGLLEKIAESKIDESQLHIELDLAHKVLANHRLRQTAVDYDCEKLPDGGLSFEVSIGFFGSFEEELAFGSELAIALAELPHWNPCVLSIQLKYIEEDAMQAA